MLPTPPPLPSRNYGHWPPPLPDRQSGSTPIPLPMPVSVPASTSAYEISRQQTAPQPLVMPLNNIDSGAIDESEKIVFSTGRRKRWQQVVVVGLLLALCVALFFTWNAATPAASPASSALQQNFTGNPGPTNTSSTTNATSSGDTITVYIVGAVKRPGVYSLPSNARVYQLLQAAGGPLSNANLVALNLASKLSDGEEIYVVRIGETPPTYSGGVPQPGPGTSNSTGSSQLININTASSDEMRQVLHISSTTAQAIINYRTQNGPYTSVDQLQQVVSQSIYDKIKDEVTV